jgi:hypothetical protein
MSFGSFFHSGPRCFCFLHISPIIFSLLLPPTSLSHRRQTSWPAQTGATKAARASGPASALEIFHGPTKSHATPSGSLHEAAFLCHIRCWRHGEPPLAPARQLRPRFCLLVGPSPAAQAQATILPLVPIKAPPEAPELVAPNPNFGESPPARGL